VLEGDARTNILFARLPAAMRARLTDAGFLFYGDRRAGAHEDAVRLVTSFATSPAAVDDFIATAV
jgi:threonine aldolase